MNATTVPQLTERVVDALALVIDVSVNNEQRRNANALLEEVKSDVESVIGMQLALNLMNGVFFKNKPVPGISDSNKEVFAQTVRHFGLQLIENIIKYKWNSLNADKKSELKILLEDILKANENNVSQDVQLKHGLSKCIVECMKREWPQNWPYILESLLSLKRNECVLFIFWRLAEDIGVFYLPNNAQRRRELNVEILLNLNRIMEYISNCFGANDIHLSVIALKTLTGFLEWCGLDALLLSFLSDNLGLPFSVETTQMKLLACECLIICLTRKGLKVEERKTLLVLFNENNLNSIIRAVRTSVNQLINSNLYSNDLFDLSKRLCYVFSLMGQVAVSLNSCEISFESLTVFLETQLEVFTCGNQVLNSISLQFWRDFIRCHQWSKAFINEPIMKKILSVIPSKLIKQTFDFNYMGYEFDGQEDYEAFYYKFRAEVIEILRNLTSISEDACFLFSTSLLKAVFDNCSSSKNEWEVIAIIMDAVANKLSNIEKFSSDGQLIFKYILERIGLLNDPDIISSQLSCLSALFVFLPFMRETSVLQEMLDKIFTLALFSIEGQTKQNRSKAVKNLRRHACCAFVKLSRTYPKLLISLFSGLKSHIATICVSGDELSQMEKCTLNEGLLLISNELEDLSIQQEFVNELVFPLSGFCSTVINTPQFISFIGLDVNSENDTFGENRANIIYAVNTIVGLLKRVNRKQVLLPCIFHLIQALYPLIINLNSLWKPEYQSIVHSEYKQLIFSAITETYRIQLLELPLIAPSAEGNLFKTPAHRMQTFLWSLYENTLSALGVAFSLLIPEIYLQSFPFSHPLIDCQYLPDAKLRMILKLYVKPLINNCPNEENFHKCVISSVIQNFLPFLFRRINGKWESMKVKNNDNYEIDNDLVESELIDEQLCRLLSREFVELLTNLCIQSKSQKNSNIEDAEMADEVNYQSIAQEAVFSQLGEFVLKNMPDVLIIASAVSLTWMDSFVSNKSAVLNSILFKKLIADNYIKSVDETTFLFQQVLTALSYFGEHEQNQAILLQLILILYEGIVMRSPNNGIKEKLSEISGEAKEKWDSFEEKWMKPIGGKGQIPDKRKKEALKSLLASLIGKNIGQLYKRNKDEIRNLRPLIFNRRKNNAADLETFDLCKLFDA